jgi:MEMO1 family protein
VIMAALEEVAAGASNSDTKGKFHFLRYERSSDPVRHSDSSVSYVSAVAIL